MAQDDEVIDQVFKVRLVEKLKNISQNNHSKAGGSIFDQFGDFSTFNSFKNYSDTSNNLSLHTFDIQLAKYLLTCDKTECELDSPDEHGFYLIHYLTKFNLVESIKSVYQKDCKLFPKNNNRISPLHIALSLEYTHILEFFLEYGREEEGYSCLQKLSEIGFLKDSDIFAQLGSPSKAPKLINSQSFDRNVSPLNNKFVDKSCNLSDCGVNINDILNNRGEIEAFLRQISLDESMGGRSTIGNSRPHFEAGCDKCEHCHDQDEAPSVEQSKGECK